MKKEENILLAEYTNVTSFIKPFILENMNVSNLGQTEPFSFRLITFSSQLSYVSVTVKRNFTSKLRLINRLKIPQEGSLLIHIFPAKL